jgi:hypothetical protein
MNLMDRVRHLMSWCERRPETKALNDIRHVTYATPVIKAADLSSPRPLRPLLVTDSANHAGLHGAGAWLLDLRTGNDADTLRDVTRHLDTADLDRLNPQDWISAPCIVLDENAALAAVHAGLPRHPNLVVVATGVKAWPAAVRLTDGTAAVITLPENTGWLLTHIAGWNHPGELAPSPD